MICSSGMWRYDNLKEIAVVPCLKRFAVQRSVDKIRAVNMPPYQILPVALKNHTAFE